ncbi:MAG: hypothetical protein EA425_10205 [Puniceicoccaceae bacterium]|nr:MAG: hypothetical protein EA425_10205 [Puniceicoccaceae bacterium]
MGVDLRVDLDDCLGERGLVFHLEGESPGFKVIEGAVLDEGVEGLKVGAGDWSPESAPQVRFDTGSDQFDEVLVVAVLFPEADEEDERLLNGELPEGVAHVDGPAPADGLGIDGDAAVAAVDLGGEVPLLSVIFEAVAIEESVSGPGFEDEPVVLDLLGGEGGEDGEEKEEGGENAKAGRRHGGLLLGRAEARPAFAGRPPGG